MNSSVALENITVDKVVTVPTARSKKHDTSAPMEIGMAAKADGECEPRERETQGSWTLLQAVYKGTGKGKWSFGKGQSWKEKGVKGGEDGGKNPWQKGSGKKGGKGQEKGGKGETGTCWTCGKTGHTVAWRRKGGNTNLYAIDENIEESADNEEDMQAWCLLGESENEQWQEVISRRDKQRTKKVKSSVTVERGEQSQFESEEDCGGERQVGESQGVTMDSGAAGHVMLETMFPHVKLERTTSPKKFVAANWRADQRLG